MNIKRSGFVLTVAPWIGAATILIGSFALLSSAAPNAAQLPDTDDVAAGAADVCVDALSKDI